MMPTGLQHHGLMQSPENVSILVLLDDAYRLWVIIPGLSGRGCFNPCSSGWCLPAYRPINRSRCASLVSILVLLDDAYRLEPHTQSADQWMGFQSLFFWMMPTGSSLFSFLCFKISVSILVLLDDAYRPIRWCDDVTYSTKFQSLFFWMMPTGKISISGKSKKWLSFNPCSSGWCLPAARLPYRP